MSFGGGGGSSSIAGANDVVLNSPANTQVIAYDSAVSKWRNSTMTGTFNPRGAWVAATAYAVNDIFTSGGQTYRVVNAHTSGGGPPSITGPWTNLELWASRGVDGSGAPNSIETLPAGSVSIVQKTAGGIWPGGDASTGVRPTSRADVTIMWKGPDPSPAIISSGTGGMLNNVDIRLITP